MQHNNPVRGRINAAILSMLDNYMHRKYAAIKRQLFADAPSVIVELGSGTGANLRYIPKGHRLIAIEPNVHMHKILQKKAVKNRVELDLRGVVGEQLDLADNSVDFIFCSLVLCTVADPVQVISEVRRVLKPGGRFVCIEHVHAHPSSFARKLQNSIRKPWRWFFEGCDLCRDTGNLLESSGFDSVTVEPFTLPTMFYPIRPQIKAICIN
ncbi:MAG: class I SAM-dependent methyltransferase [Kangiellaceae bacterium]|jgi:ubiquinone/menaquinone biosynthesis C-methylase UbiE|nr:class I SAM-dependent methyltransferase [Kangiellaceae bacterium]